MISNWLSAVLARKNIHYGWVMVLLSYLPAFFAAGALCIVAALITLMISRQPKPVMA
ncbi:MAG TPA: hypothetical protein VGO49_10070 [Bradyrhizobium sp.]|jgi:hypothetical protein|nr:hypothetical protein [Bradyrhizobium sp.]